MIAVPTLAAPAIGRPAPTPDLIDAIGWGVSLADCRGRIVVVERNDPGCPFTRKHHAGGDMRRTRAIARRGVVDAGGPGRQGQMAGARAAAFVAEGRGAADAAGDAALWLPDEIRRPRPDAQPCRRPGVAPAPPIVR